MFIQFFNVHKIEYATAGKFEYDEEKLGTNCIFQDRCKEVFGRAKGKVVYEILGVSQSSKAKYKSIIAHGKKFIQYTKKLGIIQYRTIGSSHKTQLDFRPRAAISTSTFVIGQTKDDFINNMPIDFPLDPVIQSLDVVTPFVGTIGVVIYHGVKWYFIKKQRRKKTAIESTELKEYIDNICKQDGMLLATPIPKSSKKKN